MGGKGNRNPQRMNHRRRKLAGLVAVGMCFQTASCALDTDQLLPDLLGTITTLFITDYVNNLFGVSASPF